MKIFFAIYSLLWTIALPFLKKGRRLKIGLSQRFVCENYAKSACKEKILLYAASGGEALLACTFILKRQKADCVYYCFSWTKEGVDTFNNFAKKHDDIVLHAYYTPFDKPVLIEKALREIEPTYCYIFETEIWFGLLRACKDLDIPFSFINARMTEKSFKNLSKLSFILKKLAPQKVYALSEDDAQRFSQIFSNKHEKIEVYVRENLKFELARTMLEQSHIFENSSDKACLLFASVREEEEGLLLPIIKKLRKEFPQTCFIICPKHVQRAEFWKNELEASLLVSEENIKIDTVQSHFEKENKMYIWNTFGDLRNLYSLADFCFVGASLVPLGGQNFLEPLVFGTKTYVGEHLKNFLWVFEKEPDLRASLIESISSADDLYKRLNTELACFNKVSAKEEKHKRRQFFKKWLGSSPQSYL